MSEKIKGKASRFSPLRKWWSIVVGIIIFALIIMTLYWEYQYELLIMPLFFLSKILQGFLISPLVILATTFAIFDRRVWQSSNIQVRILRIGTPIILAIATFGLFSILSSTDRSRHYYVDEVQYNSHRYKMFYLSAFGPSGALIYDCDTTGTFCILILEDLRWENEQISWDIWEAENIELTISQDGNTLVLVLDGVNQYSYSLNPP